MEAFCKAKRASASLMLASRQRLLPHLRTQFVAEPQRRVRIEAFSVKKKKSFNRVRLKLFCVQIGTGYGYESSNLSNLLYGIKKLWFWRRDSRRRDARLSLPHHSALASFGWVLRRLPTFPPSFITRRVRSSEMLTNPEQRYGRGRMPSLATKKDTNSVSFFVGGECEMKVELFFKYFSNKTF